MRKQEQNHSSFTNHSPLGLDERISSSEELCLDIDLLLSVGEVGVGGAFDET